jgi:hypothetical protein
VEARGGQGQFCPSSFAAKEEKSQIEVGGGRLLDLSQAGSLFLTQLLLKVGLEEKIKPQRLTQVKLVGLCEDQITKLDYLSAEERSKLASVLREYIIAHDLQTIQYSSSMIKFF